MNRPSLDRRALPRPAWTLRAPACLVLALGLGLGLAVPAGAQIKEGRQALEDGRVDDALAAFRTEVARSPGDAQAHLWLGTALERKRNWTAALESFRKASELDPRLAEPYRGQGSALLRLDRAAEAEAAFRKATDIDRKFPEAQLGLGTALARQGKVAEAIQVLEQGVKFGRKTEMLFFEGLGRAEALRDSLRDAEVWLLKARESAENQGSTPPSVRGTIYRSLGDLYMQRKIPSLAIQNYQQAAEIDPSDLDTKMALGDAYYRGQLYNDALNQYKAVVEANPEYAEGYYKLGNLYYLASFADPSRILQAIETLEQLVALDPSHLDGKALLAQAWFRRGGTEGRTKAKDLLDEIRATGQFPPEAYRTLGVIQYESREWQNALASFARAPKLEPLDQFRVADAYRRLAAESADADSLRSERLYASADSVYAAVIAADSTTADAKKAQLERGKLDFLRKDFAGAVEAFRHSLSLDPASAEAYYYMGLSQRAMGEDAAGVQSIEKAVELEPGDGGRWIQLGAGYQKLDRLDDAKRAFQKAAEVDSSTAGAIGLQQLGYYELLAKDWGGAIRFLDQSAQRDDKQVMTWVWLGQAYQNAGNRGKAIEAYRRALELNPREPNAQKGLKALGA